MSPNLEALLERATKRPWKVNGRTDGATEGAWLYTSAYDIAKDMIREDADLAAIAVNHFERLVATAQQQASLWCQKWRVKPCGCDSCVARRLLESIEAAAKGE